MHAYIEERALEIGRYIINTNDTVRGAARIFGVSKSTVHKDVTDRLPKINPTMALQVKKVLEQNFAQKHIRGGRVTRLRYRKY